MADNMTDKNNFINTIVNKINNLKTLEIRTIVGPFEWNETTKKIEFKKEEVKAIVTQIDLLEGDITTAFGEEFLREPFDKVREFHAEREQRGQEIIEGNFKALKAFVELAIKTFGEKEKTVVSGKK